MTSMAIGIGVGVGVIFRAPEREPSVEIWEDSKTWNDLSTWTD